MIRVDGTTYTWMGNPGPASVTQTAFEYTSTKSVFTMDVGGKIEMNITFLSPITPEDQKRQSLIFSYLDVEVQSVDGASHDVQLYADISAGKSLPASLKIILTRPQNGLLVIMHPLRNGSTILHLMESRIIVYIDKPSWNSVKPLTKRTGGTGIGRPKIWKPLPISLAQIPMFAATFSPVESYQIRMTPTTVLLTRTIQYLVFQTISAP